ncbi:hypothetical protein HZ994_02365 [Akkermansiaceae bacterium]|nr:hypothetical protein HZ994_02365 [Akkermansiaceae bacterium]
MDRFKYIPDRVFLTAEAANPSHTAEGFERRIRSHGKQRPEFIILSVKNGKHKLISVICHRLTDDRWRIARVDVNIPSLLHGHNGRSLVSEAELALALTRLRHFLRRITVPESHGRLLPGIGINNHGFLSYQETMFQIQDPGHRLLRASHTSRRRYQQKAPLIRWGQSTRFTSVESDISIYDKHAQRRKGLLSPAGIPGVRIELILKNPERIAQEILAGGEFPKQRGAVIRTVTMAAGYASVRRALSRMDGWGEKTDEGLSALRGPACLLILGLGAHIADPFAVDAVIDRYRETYQPCARTLGKVEHALRSYATSYVGGTSVSALPEDFGNLPISELHYPQAEIEYKILLKSWEAPQVPDPDIAEAWSRTTFLSKRPEPHELVGHTASDPLPWTKTL